MTAFGSLIGLLVVGWPLTLAAQPTARFALSWNGPPGCPTAEDVQARVDALLGGGASAGRVADVRASGQVERVENGFRLLLSMGIGSTPSSRVIQARTCDELAGAAAIAIALLARSTIESSSAPSASDATAPSSPANEPPSAQPAPTPSPSEETPSNAKEAPVEPATTESSTAGLHLLVDAPFGAVGWGSLPAAGLGLGAGLGIRWKALRATVSGELWKPQTSEASGLATRFTLQSGRAEACLIQTLHGLELGPCVGAALQVLSGEGIRSPVFSAKSRRTMWISGAGGLFVSLPMPSFAHLRFFGEASVLVSPRRPRFIIDQLGLVHEPALGAPQLDLGCEWIF